MCESTISTNVIKYTRGLTRRSRMIKKIRQSKIKKKYTFKKRAKYCPLLRQKKKNKKQEEDLKNKLVKNFKTRTVNRWPLFTEKQGSAIKGS